MNIYQNSRKRYSPQGKSVSCSYPKSAHKTSDVYSYFYVLQLEKDKYYVGATNNVEDAIARQGDGAGWVKKHPFVSIVGVYDWSPHDNQYTKTFELMRQHGVENVRGGSFCKVNMSPTEISALTALLSSTTTSVTNTSVASTADGDDDSEDEVDVCSRLKLWCEKSVERKLELNLLDFSANRHFVYRNNHMDDGAINLDKTKQQLLHSGMCDVLIDNDEYLLVLKSETGQRNKIKPAILTSIDIMLSTGQYVAVDFDP